MNNISPLQGLLLMYHSRWTMSNAEVFCAYGAMNLLIYRIVLKGCLPAWQGNNIQEQDIALCKTNMMNTSPVRAR
jgi:hypothetical protein